MRELIEYTLLVAVVTTFTSYPVALVVKAMEGLKPLATVFGH